MWQVVLVSDLDQQDEAQKSTRAMVSQIVQLWTQLVLVHEEAEDRFRLQAQSADLWRGYLQSRLLRDADTRVVVAMEGSQVLGFLVARIEHPAPMFEGNPYGFISDSFVRPECRRQGITTSLFNAATRWLAGRGVDELQLDVYNRNSIGWEFWINKGFRPLKTRMVRSIRHPEPND